MISHIIFKIFYMLLPIWLIVNQLKSRILCKDADRFS